MAPKLKLTPQIVDVWLEKAWRDGLVKGQDGRDDLPDFRTLYPDIIALDSHSDPAELSKLSFNDTKCEARILKDGYGVQCTRSRIESGCLCKIHQKKFDGLPDGLDIPFGRYNQPRPLESLDRVKGNRIAWHDLKKEKKPKSSAMKVADLRDYLATRIPNVNFAGLKKAELQELYDKEKSLESSSSEGGSDSDSDSGEVSAPAEVESPAEAEAEVEAPAEVEVEAEVAPAEAEAEAEVEVAPAEVEAEVAPAEVEAEVAPAEVESPAEVEAEVAPAEVEAEVAPAEFSIESFEPEPEPDTVDEVVSAVPSSLKDYKELFLKLGLDTTGLTTKRAFKMKYEEHLASDVDSEDDLVEDTSDYAEQSFEEVNYLEDVETGKLYNMKHELVGEWNDDCDDIVWVSDKFRDEHASGRE